MRDRPLTVQSDRTMLLDVHSPDAGRCRSDKQAYKRIGCPCKTLLYRDNGISCRAHKPQVAQYQEYACCNKDYRAYLGFKELSFLRGCPLCVLPYGFSRT